MNGYQCVVADPPWFETGGGKIKRGADRHYGLMHHPEILALMRSVIDGKLGESCHLWLWATDNHLLEAIYVMQGLGFRLIRSLVWVKLARHSFDDGRDVVEHARDALQTGLGQYLRGSHESCLLGVRGRTKKPDPAVRCQSVIFAPRGRHSAKPDEAYQVIEATSPGPRLEMFARSAREGWDRWGNEAPI